MIKDHISLFVNIFKMDNNFTAIYIYAFSEDFEFFLRKFFFINYKNYLEGKEYKFYVSKNDEYKYQNNKEKCKEFPDGFLYFPYRVELYFLNEKIAIDLISSFIKKLWENNIPAIAACDFEDELPEKGGYKSKNIPWPEED